MQRMNVFLKYLLVFIILYVLFDFLTYRYLVNSYKNIKTYEIVDKAPNVIINEAKATAVNGYIVGEVTNNTGVDIQRTNIKLDLYNTRGNNVGTTYLKLEDFKSNEIREFKLSFRGSNVSDIKISFTSENVDTQIEKETKELQETANKWFPFIGLVTLICII